MEMITEPQIGDKPVFLVDVDGVLLVEHEAGAAPAGYQTVPGGSKYCSYNPRHGEWIKEVLPKVDAYWLTSHDDRAHNDIGRHLDLPEFPAIDSYPFTLAMWRRNHPKSDPQTDRRDVIEEFFPERAVIWLDDWLTHTDFTWAERRCRLEARTLLIQPNSLEGLKRTHINQMLSWLGNLANE